MWFFDNKHSSIPHPVRMFTDVQPGLKHFSLLSHQILKTVRNPIHLQKGPAPGVLTLEGPGRESSSRWPERQTGGQADKRQSTEKGIPATVSRQRGVRGWQGRRDGRVVRS